MVLQKKFYQQSSKIIAQKLLGAFLVTTLPEGKTVGMIAETESYLGKNDPASHSFKGETKRNSAMFLEGGHVDTHG